MLMGSWALFAGETIACLNNGGIRATFTIPGHLKVKEKEPSRVYASNFDRPGHMLLKGNLAVSLFNHGASESIGDWVLHQAKVAIASVDLRYLSFASGGTHGILLKGQWGDAGDGRDGAYLVLSYQKKSWRLQAEGPRGANDEGNLTKMVVGLASSAVFGQGHCPGTSTQAP
jgi:hypothetical protein